MITISNNNINNINNNNLKNYNKSSDEEKTDYMYIDNNNS